MDPCLQKNLDFATQGLKDGQFVYTAEICKNILSKQPNCIATRRMLQVASKAIYTDAILLFKIGRQVISLIYFICAFMFRKRSRLRFIQKAICAYPNSKVVWILMAQTALEEGFVDILLFAYEELNLLFPKDVRIALALGGVYLWIGDHQNALRIGQQLLEADFANMDAMILVEQASLIQMKTKVLVE